MRASNGNTINSIRNATNQLYFTLFLLFSIKLSQYYCNAEWRERKKQSPFNIQTIVCFDIRLSMCQLEQSAATLRCSTFVAQQRQKTAQYNEENTCLPSWIARIYIFIYVQTNGQRADEIKKLNFSHWKKKENNLVTILLYLCACAHTMHCRLTPSLQSLTTVSSVACASQSAKVDRDQFQYVELNETEGRKKILKVAICWRRLCSGAPHCRRILRESNWIIIYTISCEYEFIDTNEPVNYIHRSTSELALIQFQP